ncbi:MAG: N-acetyltransferase [Pseudomonadota bacterium]
MIDHVKIVEARPDNRPAIETLYPQAFPDEDLLPLVGDLEQTPAYSLVGLAGRELVAHAVFTPCKVEGSPGDVTLLGPVAVAPRWQRQGVGSLMIRSGLQHLVQDCVQSAFVLGDPAYYKRFGFRQEDRVMPPYKLPDEWRSAWQSRQLSGDATPLRGKLLVPQAWRNPALWSP